MNKLIGTIVPISSLNPEQQALLADDKFSFENTYTIEQFKEEENVNKICVKKAQGSNSLFFTYGAKTGPVSAKGIPEHPMISHVLGKAKDRKGNIIPGMAQHIYLFHEEGNGGAEVVATF